VHSELPSTLTLAYNALTKMRISSLAHGIVFVNGRVTFITSEVLSSRHDCMSNIFAYNLRAPMQLAGCKFYNRYFNRRLTKRLTSGTLSLSRNHIAYTGTVHVLVNCVKRGPSSLKSLCVCKLRNWRSERIVYVTLQLEIKKYNYHVLSKTQRFSQSLRYVEK
jgi:hypothetical protein